MYCDQRLQHFRLPFAGKTNYKQCAIVDSLTTEGRADEYCHPYQTLTLSLIIFVIQMSFRLKKKKNNKDNASLTK